MAQKDMAEPNTAEKVKNKDAEPEESKTDDLEQGLEDTFPGSDPVSASQPAPVAKKEDEA